MCSRLDSGDSALGIAVQDKVETVGARLKEETFEGHLLTGLSGPQSIL